MLERRKKALLTTLIINILGCTNRNEQRQPSEVTLITKDGKVCVHTPAINLTYGAQTFTDNKNKTLSKDIHINQV